MNDNIEKAPEAIEDNVINDNVSKAFQAVSASEVEDYKPISKSSFLKSKRKKEDILIPVEIEGEDGYMRFRYPNKRDHAIAGGDIFSSMSTNNNNNSRPNMSDPDNIEKFVLYARALIQRLLIDPIFTLDEVNEIDEDVIWDLYNALSDVFSKEGGSDVKSFL